MNPLDPVISHTKMALRHCHKFSEIFTPTLNLPGGCAWRCLVGDHDPGWEGRRHFFGAAARAMRQILIEQARTQGLRARFRTRFPLREWRFESSLRQSFGTTESTENTQRMGFFS
jgi:hypothetical protein